MTSMMVGRKVVQELQRRLNETPGFTEALSMARKCCYGPVFAVGGNVYRNLVDVVRGRDFTPKNVDFDFLCMGMIQNNTGLTNYHHSSGGTRTVPVARNPRKTKSSLAVQYKGRKVDMISIYDIASRVGVDNFSINTYLNAVPLTIQAVVFQPESMVLYTTALEDINNRHLTWNNMQGLASIHNPTVYIKSKANSLGFTHAPSNVTVKFGPLADKIPCDCPMDVIMRMGCKQPDKHM